ncbi:rhomboid family intramembrane serine protease [Vibrio sp. VB16]|uniref:rhomboid family intramembrane serine protease n=1 Tax=Vibrio sp. VB16 TaxID=2785746 RepID=UPI00189ED1D4|nr:rhomboid family intramembrane serine protease [Vibrio sp. VB16]UGA53481.1 rhomboid family intramembrane serine protease [Vibrio sp. VB16]
MKNDIIKKHLRPVFIFAVGLIVIQTLNSLSLGFVSNWGIIPRQPIGLLGIPLAPFIHHSWSHLASNLIPICILMLLVRQLGLAIFWRVSIGITLLGGGCVWILGSSGVHAGASGLIFGYCAFLISYGLLNRTLKNLFIGLLVLMLYSGLLWSLFSFQPHVSWASHVYGAAAGVVMSWINRNSTKRRTPLI